MRASERRTAFARFPRSSLRRACCSGIWLRSQDLDQGQRCSSFSSINGYFVFTQRTDLWIKYDFDNLLSQYSKDFNLVYKSKPLDYLPKNKNFSKKIKMRIVLLKKN